MRYCRNRGYVVPPGDLIAPEPFDFHFRSMTIHIGCNHLLCDACGAPVRERAGYQSDTYINRDAKKLAVAEDWAPFLGTSVRERADARLYVCNCQGMTVTRAESLEPDPEDPFGARPWHCAGHREFRIPAVLDGVSISQKTDFAALARRYYADELASTPAIARWGGDWVNRLFQLLLPTPESERLAEAALALMVDDDAKVATRAIAFFATNPEPAAADRLIDVLDANRARFERESPQPRGRTLLYWLLQSAGSRLKHSGSESPLLPRARELVLEAGPKSEYFLDAFRVVDAAWVAANLPALTAANPGFDFTAEA